MSLLEYGKNKFGCLNVVTVSIEKSASSGMCVGKAQVCNGAGLDARGG